MEHFQLLRTSKKNLFNRKKENSVCMLPKTWKSLKRNKMETKYKKCNKHQSLFFYSFVNIMFKCVCSQIFFICKVLTVFLWTKCATVFICFNLSDQPLQPGKTKLKMIKTGKHISGNTISYKIYQENKSELVCQTYFSY